jgi:ABC-2 type transport system ATP-binding protein
MDAVFRECVSELRDQGRTALLSSHMLSEVEALADRVTIIRDGRRVEVGSLAEMRHLARVSVSADLAGAPGGLASLPGVHDLRADGTHVDFMVDPGNLDQVLIALTAVGVTSLTSRPPTLEELFLRHYGDGGTTSRAEQPGTS